MSEALSQKPGRRAWKGSVPSAVADGYAIGFQNQLRFRVLIGYPSATADGTDPCQVRTLSLEAKP